MRFNFFMEGINSGINGKIILTFDDGPHSENTPAILEILERYKVPAVFFIIGKAAEKYPEIVRNISNAGHEIGNHSYSHSYFNGFFSSDKVFNEIDRTNELIESITGSPAIFYRPPFGVINPNIAKAVKLAKMYLAGWDLRSYDTVFADKNRLLNRILKRIHSSTIILLHDSQAITVKILPELLDFCKANRIEVVSLKEVINKQNE